MRACLATGGIAQVNCSDRRLAAVLRVISETNRLRDLDDVLKNVASILVEYLGFESCWIGLLGRNSQVLEGRAGAGAIALSRVRDLRLSVSSPSQIPAVAAVAERQSLILLSNGASAPSEVEAAIHPAPLGSRAYVPILDSEKVHGVICVTRDAASPITAEDMQVLEAIAQQVAIVVRNDHLLARLQKEARRWEGVATACEAVHRSVALTDVLEAIARGVVDALGFRMAVINVRQNDMFDVMAIVAPPEAVEKLSGQQIPWSEFADLMQEKFRVSRSYLIRHDQVDWGKLSMGSRIYRPNLPERGEGYWHPDDMLLIPMYYDGELIGILSVDDPEDGLIPSMSAIQTLEVFANQAAVAIAKARLFDELQARNQELDAFSYSVTHDLKTPLTTVRGYAEALSMMYGEQLGPEGRELTQRIQEGADQMATIIDDLLMLARASRLSGPAERVDLNCILRAVLRRFNEVLIERNVQVEVGSDLPFVCGHTTWVEQVFANLIDNAIKYAGRENDAPHIVIDGRQEGEMVHVWVQDNGLGFAPEQCAQLFDMFSRFHETEAPGTGLGLTIAQRAIQRMGGRIWAHSAGPGQGSTFHVLLPAKCDVCDSQTGDAPSEERRGCDGARLRRAGDEGEG